MACNVCETAFSGGTLVVSVTKSGSDARVYLENQGRNVVLIRRIILCSASANTTQLLFLRAPPDAISWTRSSSYLEPGLYAHFYTLSGVAAGNTVQAQAEYIEIEGRSRSCAITM